MMQSPAERLDSQSSPMSPSVTGRSRLQRYLMRTTAFLAALVVCLLSNNSCHALEVESIRWGFDNHVVPKKFNILSILIVNPSPSPFEGVLLLEKRWLNGSVVDAPQIEPLFMGPNSRRLVTFYPYVLHSAETWKITAQGLGGVDFERTLDSPPAGPRAFVILEDPKAIGRSSGSLQRFDETIFPPVSSATDALQGVVLDHAPRWDEPRRVAFLQWLQAGGQLHLFQGPGGNFPEFTSILAVLNAPLDRFHVGAGTVVRHPLATSKLTSEYASEHVYPKNDRPKATANQWNSNNYGYYNQSIDDYEILTPLRNMTRANHNWMLIYLLAFVYVLLIFPGCYLVARFIKDYRVVYLVLVVTIGLFSVALAGIGGRGYGEQSAVNAVAIARPLEGPQLKEGQPAPFEVSQWTQVFVIGGDKYSLAHHGAAALYTTAQMEEKVAGAIMNGVGGRMEGIDIPPYSSRGFAHRTNIPSRPFGLEVETWTGTDDDLKSLVLVPHGVFPEKPTELLALHRNNFYHLVQKDGKLQLGNRAGSIEGYLTENANQLRSSRSNPIGMGTVSTDATQTAEQQYANLLKPLIERTLERPESDMQQFLSLPPGQVRVYIYATMPEEFFIASDRLQNQAGRVLYCLDLFQPQKETP